jgi:hypothetical protein
LLWLHQKQVLNQCYAARFALGQANAGLEQNNQQMFWAGIQAFATACANISKACWGQGGRLAEDRKPLRGSLRIADDSPLANTDLRNHLEHYDERLDHWYRTSNGRFADYVIGPPNEVVGMAPINIFRHFDPQTTDVIFWGEHYRIQGLAIEIERLLPIAKQETRKLPWHRRS